MDEIATIHFTDVDSHQEGCIIVRSAENAVGLCVSLRQNGDVEVFLNVGDGKRLLEALQAAIASNEQSEGVRIADEECARISSVDPD
jgi:hypothetical protein